MDNRKSLVTSFGGRVNEFNNLTEPVKLSNRPEFSSQLSIDSQVKSRSNYISSVLPPPKTNYFQDVTTTPAQGFELSQRIKVNLPLNQFHIVRSSPGMSLQELFDVVCNERNLKADKYNLVSADDQNMQILDVRKTLAETGLIEFRLVAKDDNELVITRQRTSGDSREDKRWKGGLGMLIRKISKNSKRSSVDLPSRISAPSTSRSTLDLTPQAPQRNNIKRSQSTVNIAYFGNGTRKANDKENPVVLYPFPQTEIPSNIENQPVPKVVKAPARKKRPAPKPPLSLLKPLDSPVTEDRNGTIYDKTYNDTVSDSLMSYKTPTVGHSRTSSDSSGYHEATSVLSDGGAINYHGTILPSTLPRKIKSSGLASPQEELYTSDRPKSVLIADPPKIDSSSYHQTKSDIGTNNYHSISQHAILPSTLPRKTKSSDLANPQEEPYTSKTPKKVHVDDPPKIVPRKKKAAPIPPAREHSTPTPTTSDCENTSVAGPDTYENAFNSFAQSYHDDTSLNTVSYETDETENQLVVELHIPPSCISQHVDVVDTLETIHEQTLPNETPIVKAVERRDSAAVERPSSRSSSIDSPVIDLPIDEEPLSQISPALPVKEPQTTIEEQENIPPHIADVHPRTSVSSNISDPPLMIDTEADQTPVFLLKLEQQLTMKTNKPEVDESGQRTSNQVADTTKPMIRVVDYKQKAVPRVVSLYPAENFKKSYSHEGFTESEPLSLYRYTNRDNIQDEISYGTKKSVLPEFQFSTWNERPKKQVCLKSDSDYRIGTGNPQRSTTVAKSVEPRGINRAASLNHSPSDMKKPTVVRNPRSDMYKQISLVPTLKSKETFKKETFEDTSIPESPFGQNTLRKTGLRKMILEQDDAEKLNNDGPVYRAHPVDISHVGSEVSGKQERVGLNIPPPPTFNKKFWYENEGPAETVELRQKPKKNPVINPQSSFVARSNLLEELRNKDNLKKLRKTEYSQ